MRFGIDRVLADRVLQGEGVQRQAHCSAGAPGVGKGLVRRT